MRRTLLHTRWALFARFLSRSPRPILAGPWRSEVGFELLYWLPFLERFIKTHQISRDRLIYLGRGGSAAWFNAAGKGDILDHMPPAQLRALATQASQRTGSIKQQTLEPWEQHVCDLAMMSIGFKDYHVLSPAWMYQLLEPFWQGKESLAWLDQRLLHLQRLPAPRVSPELAKQLPNKFIAMKWYTRPTWPFREDLLLWTRKLTEAVASHMPVVLITSGMHVDDHGEIELGKIPNVLKLSELTQSTPQNNLAVQTSVIAKAQGYVGTYGGMAQGAMRFGVPTVALYHEFGQTSPMHLHLTQSLSLQSGVPFVATTPKDLDVFLPLILAAREKAVA
jgi:hypothetical protein